MLLCRTRLELDLFRRAAVKPNYEVTLASRRILVMRSLIAFARLCHTAVQANSPAVTKRFVIASAAKQSRPKQSVLLWRRKARLSHHHAAHLSQLGDHLFDAEQEDARAADHEMRDRRGDK